MGGAFGGILGLFDIIERVLLYVLIGKSALDPKVKWARVIIGSWTLGTLLGLLFFIVTQIANPKSTYDNAGNVLGSIFCGFSPCCVIIAVFLEGLRYYIEEKD
jgi:hypothetical protein